MNRITERQWYGGIVFWLMFMSVLSACQYLPKDLQTPPIETRRQALVVVEYSYQSALISIDKGIDAELITADDVPLIETALDGARASLDAARSALTNDDDNMMTYIFSAQQWLTDVIEILQRKGVI